MVMTPHNPIGSALTRSATSKVKTHERRIDELEQMVTELQRQLAAIRSPEPEPEPGEKKKGSK